MTTSLPIILFPSEEWYSSIDEASWSDEPFYNERTIVEVSRDVFLKWCVRAKLITLNVVCNRTEPGPVFYTVTTNESEEMVPGWTHPGVPPVMSISSVETRFQIDFRHPVFWVSGIIHLGRFYLKVFNILYRYSFDPDYPYFATFVDPAYTGGATYTAEVEITDSTITITASRVSGDPGYETTEDSVTTLTIDQLYSP